MHFLRAQAETLLAADLIHLVRDFGADREEAWRCVSPRPGRLFTEAFDAVLATTGIDTVPTAASAADDCDHRASSGPFAANARTTMLIANEHHLRFMLDQRP